jgi:hypothetical protein
LIFSTGEAFFRKTACDATVKVQPMAKSPDRNKELSSLARNNAAFAISSALPKRFAGTTRVAVKDFFVRNHFQDRFL